MIDVATAIIAGVGFLLLAAGAYSAWVGLRSYRHGRALATASPLTAETASGDIATSEGTVVEPRDDHSLESHYSARPCVAYACEVLTRETADREEFHESSGNIISERSRTEEDVIPFVIEANGQHVGVEASEADLSWSGADFDSVSASNVIRNRLSLRAVADLLNLLTGGGRKRRTYYEACLRPGNRVSVTGTVRRTGDEVTLERTRGVPLVVSTNPRRSVAGEYRNRGTSRFLWALILAGVGGGLLYALARTL